MSLHLFYYPKEKNNGLSQSEPHCHDTLLWKRDLATVFCPTAKATVWFPKSLPQSFPYGRKGRSYWAQWIDLTGLPTAIYCRFLLDSKSYCAHIALATCAPPWIPVHPLCRSSHAYPRTLMHLPDPCSTSCTLPSITSSIHAAVLTTSSLLPPSCNLLLPAGQEFATSCQLFHWLWLWEDNRNCPCLTTVWSS